MEYALNASWDVKEALWTLSNCFTTRSDKHIMILIQLKALEPLVEVMSLNNADALVLCAAMDAVEQVLEVSERQHLAYERIVDEYRGIDYLENLQEHPSDAAYSKAVKIIEKYFNSSDEHEDENLVPETTENGTYGFGVPSPKQLFPGDGGPRAETATFPFRRQVSDRAF